MNTETEIKYRFWNTDYTQQPMMEVGDTGDIKFVERSIGKNKMIFTGLQDKNKKDIYEGDICSQMFGKKPEIGVISIEVSRGVLVGNVPCWPHNIEIIGNIYENTELLKQ